MSMHVLQQETQGEMAACIPNKITFHEAEPVTFKILLLQSIV